MGEALKKVVTGQRLEIPAQAYNTFIDMARDWLASQMQAGGGFGTDRGQAGIVLVRNDSGADCDRFAILGIDGPIYGPTDNLDEFKNRPALKGVVPVAPDHVGKFVVLQAPLASGAIGPARLMGLTPVQLDVVNVSDEFADVKNGDVAVLQTGVSGAARILYKEAGTGTKWGWVVLGDSFNPLRFGVATAKWAQHEGMTDAWVTVHPCRNIWGDDVDASVTLTVQLPHSPASDPNVRAGQVIAFVRAGQEYVSEWRPTYICVSDVSDAKIGTIRLFANANPPPAGWAVCDGTNGTVDLRDKFIVGHGGSWPAAGGYLHHGGAENNHADHGIDGAEDGLDFNAMMITQSQTGIDHTETDNRPPYTALRMIQRID